MNRRTLFWDRLAVVVVAVLLAVFGLAGLSWYYGWWPHLTRPLDLTASHAWYVSGWWPWAMLVAGLLLIAWGLRWLLAHIGSQRVNRLALTGSTASDTLQVNVSSAAQAAADALGETLGVRRAKGSVVRDRGAMVARIVATVEPHVSLQDVSQRADQVSAGLNSVLGRDDIVCRVEFRVAGTRPFSRSEEQPRRQPA